MTKKCDCGRDLVLDEISMVNRQYEVRLSCAPCERVIIFTGWACDVSRSEDDRGLDE